MREDPPDPRPDTPSTGRAGGPSGRRGGPRVPGAEEALARAVESMGIGVQVLDRELRYRFLNDAACRQGRRSRDDLLGRRMTDVYPFLAGSPLLAALRESIERGRPQRLLNEFVHESGGSGWFELSLEPIPEGVAVVSVDVTERIRAESEARRLRGELAGSQRLDALGRLAGRIAHDFNNSLQIILGNADEIAVRTDLPTEVLEATGEIIAAGRSAAELNLQLVKVGRVEELRPRPVDLDAKLRESLGMVRRLAGASIEVTMRLCGESPVVGVDPAQLDHVLLNLVANAREAMPHGGRLDLETRVVELDESDVEGRPDVEPGQYAVLLVSDSGIGMDEETRARIFEPFFTTRPDGGGSGLGLAGVYGVVKQSGGHIWVYSEPGRGTVFKLHFRTIEGQAAGQVAGETSGPSSSPSVGTEGELILVVEDDPPIRTLFRRILERSGYRVLSAADGRGALTLLEDRDLQIDLLITDLVLPGMSGFELYERVRTLCGCTRVLLVSGYDAQWVSRDHAELESLPFLEKPVTPRRLLEAVRRALGSG